MKSVFKLAYPCQESMNKGMKRQLSEAANHPNLKKYMKSGMNPELLPSPEDEETLPDFANQGCSPPHTLNVLFQEFISHTELCFKKLRNQ
jgi:hypothetical protein